MDATRGGGGALGLVHGISGLMDRLGRRGFLLGAAVAGSALATRPKEYTLRPVAAYATICGPGNTAASGWTVFCCTINGRKNSCPPGSFAAGWWKAADSSWCGGGYRYIVDCNAACAKCTSGCGGDHICDSTCWNCSCGRGSSATCDQRRVCCNAFRYGQCNTQISCSGGVHCRMVSCVPPYQWANCTTTSLVDNRTSEHSAPCLPSWGYIAARYKAMGEQGSFLGSSLGPVRATSDGRGTCVPYQGGYIYYTSSTGAWAMTNFMRERWLASGYSSTLGYPTGDKVATRDGGFLQLFQHGCITDSGSTSTQAVYGYLWTLWKANGREGGVLRYPTGPRTEGLPDAGVIQTFQNGCIVDSASTPTQLVHSYIWTIWQANGRETGVLRYPTGPRTEGLPDTGVIQTFQKGCIVDSASTVTSVVHGVRWTAWQEAGREKGVLGYPDGAVTEHRRGRYQVFQKGELWSAATGPAYRVYGGVLAAWREAGGADGEYGLPVSDTVRDGEQLTCTFEGGVITA